MDAARLNGKYGVASLGPLAKLANGRKRAELTCEDLQKGLGNVQSRDR